MSDPLQDGVSNLKNVVTNLSNIGQVLSTALGNLTAVNGSAVHLGQAVMASSIPVAIASNQSAIPVTGTFTNPSVSTTGTTVPGEATYVGVNSGGNIVGLALGQATMAASIPVAIASNQSAIPITGTISATNPSVSTTNQTTPVQATLIGLSVAAGSMQPWSAVNPAGAPNATTFAARMDLLSVNGTTVSLGAQASAVSIPVVLATNQQALTAVVSGTVSVVGTVSANQLGTWAVNLSQVGGTAIAIGSTTMASSMPVTIATDQASVSVKGTVSIGNNPVLGTGASPIGTVSANQIGTWAVNLSQVGGTVFALGRSIMATSISVTLASDEPPLTGTTLMSRGSTTSSTTSARQVLGSTGVSTTRWYVTSLQFGNSGTVMTIATMNDSASSQFVCPGTSSVSHPFPVVPLAFGLGSAVTFALSSVSTSVVCNVQAFSGP